MSTGEQRPAPIAQETSPANRFPREKFMKDTKQGFQITVNDGYAVWKYAEVVTRNGEDLFFASAKLAWVRRGPHQGYTRMIADVRRRLGVPGQGKSRTLERWRQEQNSGRYDGTDYRIQDKKGGMLEESEFWKRYEASVVDEEATRTYFEFRKQEMQKENASDVTFEEKIAPEEQDRLFVPEQ